MHKMSSERQKRDRLLLPVKDNPGLVRDSETGAILYTGESHLRKARKRREQINRRKKEQAEKDQKIENLETEISELKDMVKQLLDKK